MWNVDAIFTDEFLEQMNTLVNQPVPGVSLAIFKRGVTEGPPFLEQCRGAVLVFKVSAQRLLNQRPKTMAARVSAILFGLTFS
jgi:hypothetical protein